LTLSSLSLERGRSEMRVKEAFTILISLTLGFSPEEKGR